MGGLSQTERLRQALARFRTDLDNELVGCDQNDERAWLSKARASFDSLERVLDDQRNRVHEKLFIEVAKGNACELEHIRELRESDTQVARLLDVVKNQFIALEVCSNTDVESCVEQGPYDETAMMEIVDRGSELVHWVREQESAVTTWFTESFAAPDAVYEKCPKCGE